MIQNFIQGVLAVVQEKLQLFHTQGPEETTTPVTEVARTEEPVPVERHSIEVVAAQPRTVNFVVSGTVQGQTANRITGGERDTTESIKDLMVRLFQTEQGITSAVVTDPDTNARYDVHRNENTVRIFSEDNTYSKEFAI